MSSVGIVLLERVTFEILIIIIRSVRARLVLPDQGVDLCVSVFLSDPGYLVWVRLGVLQKRLPPGKPWRVAEPAIFLDPLPQREKVGRDFALSRLLCLMSPLPPAARSDASLDRCRSGERRGWRARERAETLLCVRQRSIAVLLRLLSEALRGASVP